MTSSGVRMVLVLVISSGLMLAGCTPDAPTPSASPTAPSAVVEALAAAKARSADPAQIEILENAVAEGRDVTYEEYLQAANAALECLQAFPEITESGLTEYSQDGGKAVSLWLTTASGDDAADASYRHCFGDHLDLVESAYQQRGSVQEWRDSVDERFIDAVRECIDARGIATEPDWTVADMLQAETDQFPEGDVNARCAAVTGYEAAITS